jgi:arabinose-5-phosphate isomerase
VAFYSIGSQIARASSELTASVFVGVGMESADQQRASSAPYGQARQIAREALQYQGNSIVHLASTIDDAFEQATELIYTCRGRVIVSGMGKSGLVGRKIAATFSSTGTPSYFLHPGEALHGDLGVIQADDLVILISNSGETEEVLRLLPSLEDFGNPIVSITGKADSTLATHSTVALILPDNREVCPNELAPTTSTLVTMALGDALAVALMTVRDFKPVDFARYHPGGSLGRRLLTRVSNVMRTRVPFIAAEAPLYDAIDVMTKGRTGMAVALEDDKLVGVLTDGDLRRAMLADRQALEQPVKRFMSRTPITVKPEARLADAEDLMRARNVHALVVQDATGAVVGLLDIFDHP